MTNQAPIAENVNEYVRNRPALDYLVNSITFFTEGAASKFLKEIQKENTQRFFDSYDFIYGSLNTERRRDLIFSIIRMKTVNSDSNLINEYYTFQDSEVKFDAFTKKLSYIQPEIEYFRQRYGSVAPELQVNIDDAPEQSTISFQNSISTDPISYDSVSSLGSITQESFTISATTGSATELITEQTGLISDAGGISGAGRDREILNERVTVDTTGISDVQPGTVRTSGY